jgi:hypothetical protein
MAGLAGIRAISSEQPDSAVAAGAHEDCAGCSQARPDPHNAEALNIAIAARELDMTSKEAQTGNVGVFQTDVGFIDLAVVARNDVP